MSNPYEPQSYGSAPQSYGSAPQSYGSAAPQDPYAPGAGQPYGQQPYGAQPQPYVAQPYPPAYGYVAAPEHPQGTTILVLGILGFFVGITGLIAWIMGAKAEKEMAASGIVYSNANNIKIGKILGMVTTILSALYLVGFIIYIIGMIIFVATLGASSNY